MDGDDHDHDRTPARRGRPRKDAGLSDGLEGVRRQIALETLEEIARDWLEKEPQTVEALLRELLERARDE